MVVHLVAEGSDDPFAVGVHLRHLGCAGQDVHVFGLEDGVEGGRVLHVAIAEQKPKCTQISTDIGSEVASLLCRPVLGRVGGDARDVESPCAVFEEHQGVEAFAERGVNVEEVRGDDATGLVGQELFPRRAVLLRRVGLASGLARDRVPLGRWLLSPWSTFLLWRRMVLWQTISYRTALEEEARLRRTRTRRRTRFGRRWKRKAPADLVWMLDIAPYAEDVHARVEAMISNDELPTPVPAASDAPRGVGSAEESQSSQSSGTAPCHVTGTAVDLEDALRINEDHWAQRNCPASAETLRKQLGVGAAKARELTSAVRAIDRTTLTKRLSGTLH